MKISQIKQINYFIKNPNIIKHQNNTPNYFFSNSSNYIDTVSFNGKESSRYYTDNEIYLARKSLKLNDETWKNFVFHNRNEDINNDINNKIKDIIGIKDPYIRLKLAEETKLLSEIVFFIKNICVDIYSDISAKKCVEKIDLIRTDILNAQADEKAAKTKNDESRKKNEAEYFNEIRNIKEQKLYPQLLNLIQREKEGKKTDIPNCIMLLNPNENINEKLINWCGENVNGQFIITDPYQEDLIEVLEEAENDYQETRNWNLIYVKNMDKLINSKYSVNSVIAAMKGIMTACAKEFHSTLIFSASNTDELDNIALAPHRVQQIDTSNIKSTKEENIKDAQNRLNDEEYKNKTPIAAINDILFLLDVDKDLFLTSDIIKDDLTNIENRIKEKSLQNNNYLEEFKNISKNIWYCTNK